MKKSEIMHNVISFFRSEPDSVVNYKQIASIIGVTKMVQKQILVNILAELKMQEYLLELSRGKYKLNDRSGSVEGRLERKNGGKIFLIPEDGSEDVFILEKNMNSAVVGDVVKARLFARRQGRMQEGEILEVLKRNCDTFVGKLKVSKDYAFLLVDHRSLSYDIFIPKDKLKEGKTGDKAIVKIVDWAEWDRNPIGEVVDILGATGNNNAEMSAILVEFGLPYFYPEEVEKCAGKISGKISGEEIARRLDFRKIPTFTIDPKDAKDFDDALSIRSLKNGKWEVGVHIADVTHYVKENDTIDKEAEKRATSVYLVDRTIPMLPEHLSNGLCSLRPHEEKLCYSVIFEMDEEANVLNYNIAHTVINSDRRFTYEEAQEVIETGNGDFSAEVLKLNNLAKILRQRRFDDGAIAFERTEVRFEIDEKGKPISVYFKEAKDANKLIEEFMLLANKTVASHIGKQKDKRRKAKTFVYRVHDVPDPEKLANLSQFIGKFGYRLKTTGKNREVSSAINCLLDQVQGKKEQNMIETITIRSMAKAIYTTVNVGHYGLAFDHYTHFTSPIRRYPDMMVHRLLDRYAEDGRSADQNRYEELCKHSSDMEQVAVNAERASIKYKQVEFMSDKIGKIYDGVISGIQDWGIYVELTENKCEGMVPIRNLDDDYYTFDEKNYQLIGHRFRKTYQLGDELIVRISKTNLDKRQLDFELIEKK